MPRTEVEGVCNNIQAADYLIQKILKAHKFNPTIENGELVFRKGKGFWMPFRYVKYELQSDSTVKVWGWIKMRNGNEFDLSGLIIGSEPKSQVKKVIEEILAELLMF